MAIEAAVLITTTVALFFVDTLGLDAGDVGGMVLMVVLAAVPVPIVAALLRRQPLGWFLFAAYQLVWLFLLIVWLPAQ